MLLAKKNLEQGFADVHKNVLYQVLEKNLNWNNFILIIILMRFILTIWIDDWGNSLLAHQRSVHISQERDAAQIQIQIEPLVEEGPHIGRDDFGNRKSHPEDDEQLCVQRWQDCGQGIAVIVCLHKILFAWFFFAYRACYLLA